MIMRGTTSQALSAAGFLLLAALGLLVLPLLPTWAKSEPQEPAATPAVAEQQETLPSAAPVDATAQRAAAWLSKVQSSGVSGINTEEARDEVQLFRSQLMAKQAELEESKALLRQAERDLGRKQRLHKTGAVPTEDIEQAQTEAEVQQSRVRVKEAQLNEARVRLTQAERRLSRLKSGNEKPQATSTAVQQIPPRIVGYTVGPATGVSSYAVVPPTAATVIAPQPAPTEHFEQLQAKLDRLLKEMDRLHKEMAGLRREVSELRRQQTLLTPANPALPLTPDVPQRFNQLFQVRPDGTVERKVVPDPNYQDDPRNTPTAPLGPKKGE